ncbi:hypothetical protein B0H14DRAFT_2607987 [Mycena olivaceomarginata]|nr:hypothetical protein B0H14DRAFT_2607987 [Mycena olivaceomarginata]
MPSDKTLADLRAEGQLVWDSAISIHYFTSVSKSYHVPWTPEGTGSKSRARVRASIAHPVATRLKSKSSAPSASHPSTKRIPSHNQHPTTHDGVIAMPAHPSPISASRSWLCVIAQSLHPSSHLWVPINAQAMDR